MTGGTGQPLGVIFASSVSYAQALRLITDLGLQPSAFCGSPSVWQPVGQHDLFEQGHFLVVAPGYETAPDDWSARLLASPGVQALKDVHPVYPGDQIEATPDNFVLYPCPPILTSSPPSGSPMRIGNHLSYARVSFVAQQTYDLALYTISNLGLGLADLCYEQALSQGNSPIWHPMGQEHAFSTTHALIVQTPGLASNMWQQQLAADPNISKIETPLALRC